MTDDLSQADDLLVFTARFVDVPLEQWQTELEPQAENLLAFGDALVTAWKSDTLDDVRRTTARQFIHNTRIYLINRPELHRATWLEMGMALAEDAFTRATFLDALGSYYYHIGEYHKALGYFDDALTIYHAQPDKTTEGKVLVAIGACWKLLDQPSKAETYLQEGLAMADDDAVAKIMAMGELGGLYLALSDFEKAHEYYEQALEESEQLADKKALATSLNNFSLVEPDGKQALSYLKESLEIHRALGHKPCEAITLMNIAQRLLGANSTMTLKYAEAGLQVAIMLKNLHKQAQAYLIIGQLHTKLRDYHDAKSALEKAFELAQTASVSSLQVWARFHLAMLQRKMRQPQDAIATFEEALKIAQGGEYDFVTMNIITQIADVYHRQKDLPNALAQYQRLVTFAGDVANVPWQATAYGACSVMLKKMRRFDEAIDYLQKGIEILQDNNLTHDSNYGTLDGYLASLVHLQKRRDGWVNKYFPFLPFLYR